MSRLHPFILAILLSVGYPSMEVAVAFGTKSAFEPFLLLPRAIPPKRMDANAVGRGLFSLHLAAKNSISTTCKNPRTSVPERKEGEPWYWIGDDARNAFGVTYRKDENVQQEQNTPDRISNVYFKLRGNPRPLQRHRTSRGHMYNPSLKYQRSFLDAFENLITSVHGQTIDAPFFSATEHLAITIVFRMKRPKSHFVNNRPGPDRLKRNAPSQLSSIRTDVDNLTKFVLDSMNGVLYEDDRQITSIYATKLLDNEFLCEGSIEVCVRSVVDVDVEKMLQSLAFPSRHEAEK